MRDGPTTPLDHLLRLERESQEDEVVRLALLAMATRTAKMGIDGPDRRILVMARRMLGQPLRVIARDMGVTAASVHQTERAALRAARVAVLGVLPETAENIPTRIRLRRMIRPGGRV